jgi:hypothetical protein
MADLEKRIIELEKVVALLKKNARFDCWRCGKSGSSMCKNCERMFCWNHIHNGSLCEMCRETIELACDSDSELELSEPEESPK